MPHLRIKVCIFIAPQYELKMKGFTLLSICLLCFFSRTIAQSIENTSERNTTFSQDTELINQYVNRLSLLPNNFTKKDIDTAHYYLRKIFSLSLNRNYNKGLAEYYRLSSTVYNSLYRYDSSKEAIEKELYWARQSGDPMEVAEAFAASAIRYEYLDGLDSAAKYYIKAACISDSVKNLHFSGSIYNNLAIIFYNINDYQNAERYAIAGYRIGKQLNDSTIFINCLLNLAGIKKDLKHQYDTAMLLYGQVRDIANHSDRFKSSAFNALINEGDILSYEKHYQEALARYRSVLNQKEAVGAYMLGYVYSGMGNTFYMLKQYANAEKYISHAIQIDKNIHARQELGSGYSSLSEIKAAEKQFEQSLIYREKYDSLQDSLTDEANKKNMHLLEIKYQTARKDKQIAKQNLTLIQKQHSIERKNLWLFIFLIGIIALAVILILSIRSYRHKKRLHEQSLLTIQKQHEVNTLKAKMDAREEERNRIGREMHDDIGSALTTILYLSDELKNPSRDRDKPVAERIYKTAGAVVDKMNEIIWSMNREYDTLGDLIAYTRQHAAEFLETHGLKYHFSVPEEIPDILLQGERRRNIYLVIKESLHNVIKHAQATEVNIIFRLNKNITAIICDNGKGIDTEKLKRFGNGLRNMKQRMESIGGEFNIGVENGTIITLTCPLENDKI